MTSTPSTGDLVANHWCEVLSVSDADDADNFFAIGGNSLQAVDLARRLEDEFGEEFPLEVIFIDGTLAAVKAAAIKLSSAL